LQEFVKNDKGFSQYSERYEEVSGDMAVRRLFAAWTAEMDKLDIAKELGKQEKAIEDAKRMLLKGFSPEITADCVDLPLIEVQELLQQIDTDNQAAAE